MAENEKMDSLSRMFNTLIRTPLSEIESVIRKSNLESQPVASVEELADTYTKMAAENEPMTFTENIDKPQVKQEFLADAPSFMELIPKEERLDESKFQQKVVLDTDGVYRLKTLPIEENIKTNVDILKEQIGVEQGLLNDTIADKVPVDPVPVEDFGGVNLGMQGAKQRELDDTIADKVLTESEIKDIKQAENIIQDMEREKQKSEEEPKDKEKPITSKSDFVIDDYFLSHFKNNEGIKYNLGPGAEGGKTDDIAHGHKLLGDEITTKMVYGIDVSKGVTDEQSDTIARLDIQGERGVNRAIREFNQIMKENNIKKDFKDLEKWKQNLLVDFSLNNAPAKNLAKALANDNITDIVENATDRTFKRKNKKGVLVRKYQSKRNEETYKNLIEPFIKDSVSEEKLKYYLEEVLKRKGLYNRKKHNKIK
jgi:hypothetical protein